MIRKWRIQHKKYLGNLITSDAKQDKNVASRITRAWSYLAEKGALLNELSSGRRKTEVGVMLREAMFINGVLYNSESWHGVTEKHVDKLEMVDKNLMRFILTAHA